MGSLSFKNRIGIAGGLDKNAEYFHIFDSLGFGFVEVGTITLEPQKGNPKPRIFRFSKDKTLVNSLGFNNVGSVKALENIKKITIDQFRKEETDIGNQAVRMIKQYTPGSSIWYIRLAFERLIADRVAQLVDPNVQQRRNRLINSYLRDTQQEYWWKPGEILPNN